MDIRTVKMCFLPWMVLLLLAGCADPMLQNVESSGAARPAPASQPAKRSWLTKPKPASAQPEQQGDVFLLYLSAIGKTGSIPQSPYTQIVPLKNVAPARAVYLVTSLTEPSGQGGSGDRLFLVYTDPAVQDWAANLAVMLDVPANQNSDWARAVTRLLAVAGPRLAEPADAEKILKQLEPLCAGHPDPQYRWPACMFAGRLLDEILGRPREAAGRFEQASAISLRTSPAWLVARFAQARALRAAGDRPAARTIAADIVQHAGPNFTRTRAYREAQQMTQGK